MTSPRVQPLRQKLAADSGMSVYPCVPSSRRLILAFDADDTLWHNENIFEDVHARYRTLLARYHDAETVERTLFATEMRNLELYGYGVKGFTLSAIETAIELTKGALNAEEVGHLLALGREMLAHPVVLLDGVEPLLVSLKSHYDLMLITKGDLRDQERKLGKSGLRALFSHVEIVSEKDDSTYAAVFAKHGIRPEDVLMTGNSLKSDILPVLALGGAAVYIPYPLTWAHERSSKMPDAAGRFWKRDSMSALPSVIEEWIRNRS